MQIKMKIYLTIIVFLLVIYITRPKIILHAPAFYTVECGIDYGTWSEYDGTATFNGLPLTSDDWDRNEDIIRYILPEKKIRILCPLIRKEGTGILIVWNLYTGKLIQEKQYLFFENQDTSELIKINIDRSTRNYLFLWNKIDDFNFFRLHVFIDNHGNIIEQQKYNLFGQRL
jgi:hypothetical protein